MLTSILFQSRRKSASPATTVKSPSIKRCDEAPVTLHGWLFKQGSDGLMLWKKRWFVLSEYCLFYYKGEFLLVMTIVTVVTIPSR